MSARNSAGDMAAVASPFSMPLSMDISVSPEKTRAEQRSCDGFGEEP